MLQWLEKAFTGGKIAFFLKDAIRRMNTALPRLKTRKEAEAWAPITLESYLRISCAAAPFKIQLNRAKKVMIDTY